MRGNNPCFPVSRLVTIENTHAQCGGKVLPMDYLDDLAQLAQVIRGCACPSMLFEKEKCVYFFVSWHVLCFIPEE